MPCGCCKLSSTAVADIGKYFNSISIGRPQHKHKPCPNLNPIEFPGPCLDDEPACPQGRAGDPCAICEHYSCAFGSAGRCEQVARQKDTMNRSCKTLRFCSMKTEFPCAADLEKYFSPSFPSKNKGGAKTFQRPYKPRNCSKEDPCIDCLNAVIKNLLKTLDCSIKKDEPKDDCNKQKKLNCDFMNENSKSCNKPKKSCDKSIASRCAASCESEDEDGGNQCPGDNVDCDANKKETKKCEEKCRIQNHDFCSKFASCPMAEDDRSVSETELMKCFMMQPCAADSNFQTKRRNWLSDRAVSLLVNVRDKNLKPIKPNPDEVFPSSCCLGWQIGRQFPKKKSKFSIQPYDPMIMCRNRKKKKDS